MFSNRYIFIYSTILVVIVATVLALAATLLKPFQNRNVEIEKIQYILQAVHIQSTPQNAEKLYQQNIVEELAVDSMGTLVSTYSNGVLDGAVRPFSIDLKQQLRIRKDGGNAIAPIYVCKKGDQLFFIVPMLGNGLWGPIWGNVALADDFTTITGITFDHKGETPGLGAEITTVAFQETFINKKIFDNQLFTSVRVLKNADTSAVDQVNALSGGTITSEGVSKMLNDNLVFYKGFKSNTLPKYQNK